MVEERGSKYVQYIHTYVRVFILDYVEVAVKMTVSILGPLLEQRPLNF